jgi:hypothetical protein
VLWIANRGVHHKGGVRSWEEIQKSRIGPRRACIGGSQGEGKILEAIVAEDRRSLSGPPLVSVVKSSDLRNHYDAPTFWLLHCS